MKNKNLSIEQRTARLFLPGAFRSYRAGKIRCKPGAFPDKHIFAGRLSRTFVEFPPGAFPVIPPEKRKAPARNKAPPPEIFFPAPSCLKTYRQLQKGSKK